MSVAKRRSYRNKGQLMASLVINSLGLIFDILGTILLFNYGLPSKFHESSGLLLESDLNDNEKKENKKINCFARLGLIFLILGFILQFISNFL